MKERLFFSIVIPARNEEKYLPKTLRYLRKMNYPKSNYEIIVVENGSTDRTYQIASKFRSKTTKVFASKKAGVSIARNFGAAKASRRSDWLIFLDADTILKPKFLNELNSFLNKPKNHEAVTGATTILPLEKNLKSKLWLGFYNIFRELFNIPFTVQIVKTSAFRRAKYDVQLKFSEDMEIIKQLLKFGDFFFLKTDQAETSTRRFEKAGYARTMFKWACGTLTPKYFKRRKPYEVIR